VLGADHRGEQLDDLVGGASHGPDPRWPEVRLPGSPRGQNDRR
jgi:hypothetical protein